MAQRREHLTVGANADADTEDQGTQRHEAHVAVGCLRRQQMEHTTEETEDEEREDDQTAFHAASPFRSDRFVHRQSHKAHNALPTEAASAIATASAPRRLMLRMISSSPPTSTPKRKSKAQMRTVVSGESHDSRFLLSRRPTTMPHAIIRIIFNMIYRQLPIVILPHLLMTKLLFCHKGTKILPAIAND